MMSRKHLLRRIQNRREIPINWIITSIDCSLYVLLFKMKSCTSNILVTKVKKKIIRFPRNHGHMNILKRFSIDRVIFVRLYHALNNFSQFSLLFTRYSAKRS
jgi:hypothetical protein